jgi:hypothetical protein
MDEDGDRGTVRSIMMREYVGLKGECTSCVTNEIHTDTYMYGVVESL